MPLDVGKVAEEVVARQTAVDLGARGHLRRGVGVLLVLLSFVVTRVVDLHIAHRIGRVVTVFTHKTLHHVVSLHVALQVRVLHRLVITPAKITKIKGLLTSIYVSLIILYVYRKRG